MDRVARRPRGCPATREKDRRDQAARVRQRANNVTFVFRFGPNPLHWELCRRDLTPTTPLNVFRTYRQLAIRFSKKNKGSTTSQQIQDLGFLCVEQQKFDSIIH